MKYLFLLGVTATIIGIISFSKIVYNVHITGKTNNFPYISLFMALSSNLLWFIYGLIKKDGSVILMGLLYALLYFYILFRKVYIF